MQFTAEIIRQRQPYIKAAADIVLEIFQKKGGVFLTGTCKVLFSLRKYSAQSFAGAVILELYYFALFACYCRVVEFAEKRFFCWLVFHYRFRNPGVVHVMLKGNVL